MRLSINETLQNVATQIKKTQLSQKIRAMLQITCKCEKKNCW